MGDLEDMHEYYAREGSGSIHSPYGDVSPGGGNLESVHEYYLREGMSCPISPMESYNLQKQREQSYSERPGHKSSIPAYNLKASKKAKAKPKSGTPKSNTKKNKGKRKK